MNVAGWIWRVSRCGSLLSCGVGLLVGGVIRAADIERRPAPLRRDPSTGSGARNRPPAATDAASSVRHDGEHVAGRHGPIRVAGANPAGLDDARAAPNRSAHFSLSLAYRAQSWRRCIRRALAREARHASVSSLSLPRSAGRKRRAPAPIPRRSSRPARVPRMPSPLVTLPKSPAMMLPFFRAMSRHVYYCSASAHVLVDGLRSVLTVSYVPLTDLVAVLDTTSPAWVLSLDSGSSAEDHCWAMRRRAQGPGLRCGRCRVGQERAEAARGPELTRRASEVRPL